jgi:hypothetical protein
MRFLLQAVALVSGWLLDTTTFVFSRELYKRCSLAKAGLEEADGISILFIEANQNYSFERIFDLHIVDLECFEYPWVVETPLSL